MALPDIKKWEKRFAEIQKLALAEAELIKQNFFAPGVKVLGVSGSARDHLDMAQEDSSSEALLLNCLEETKKLGAETKLLPLRQYDIRPCKACYSTTNAQCHFKCSCFPEGKSGDDMTNKIYDLLTWADVVVFATPINNFKVSSLMALFIDRMISMDGSLSPADPNDTKNTDLNRLHTKYISENSTEVNGSGFLRRFVGKIAGIIVTGHEAGASLTISSLFMTLNHYGFMFPPFSNMYAVAGIVEDTSTDKKKVTSEFFIEDARSLGRNLMTAAKIAKRTNDYEWSYKGNIN